MVPAVRRDGVKRTQSEKHGSAVGPSTSDRRSSDAHGVSGVLVSYLESSTSQSWFSREVGCVRGRVRTTARGKPVPMPVDSRQPSRQGEPPWMGLVAKSFRDKEIEEIPCVSP